MWLANEKVRNKMSFGVLFFKAFSSEFYFKNSEVVKTIDKITVNIYPHYKLETHIALCPDKVNLVLI